MSMFTRCLSCANVQLGERLPRPPGKAPLNPVERLEQAIAQAAGTDLERVEAMSRATPDLGGVFDPASGPVLHEIVAQYCSEYIRPDLIATALVDCSRADVIDGREIRDPAIAAYLLSLPPDGLLALRALTKFRTVITPEIGTAAQVGRFLENLEACSDDWKDLEKLHIHMHLAPGFAGPLLVQLAGGPVEKLQLTTWNRDIQILVGHYPDQVHDRTDQPGTVWQKLEQEIADRHGLTGAELLYATQVLEQAARHDGAGGWTIHADDRLVNLLNSHPGLLDALVATDPLYQPGQPEKYVPKRPVIELRHDQFDKLKPFAVNEGIRLNVSGMHAGIFPTIHVHEWPEKTTINLQGRIHARTQIEYIKGNVLLLNGKPPHEYAIAPKDKDRAVDWSEAFIEYPEDLPAATRMVCSAQLKRNLEERLKNHRVNPGEYYRLFELSERTRLRWIDLRFMALASNQDWD